MLCLHLNFRLFSIGKKPLEMLNFQFGRKYHFVILKHGIFAHFLLFLSGGIHVVFSGCL